MRVWVSHLWGRGQTSTCYLLHVSVIDYKLLFWHFETIHLSLHFLYCFYFISLSCEESSVSSDWCRLVTKSVRWFVFVIKLIPKYRGHLKDFPKPGCIHSPRPLNVSSLKRIGCREYVSKITQTTDPGQKFWLNSNMDMLNGFHCKHARNVIPSPR